MSVLYLYWSVLGRLALGHLIAGKGSHVSTKETSRRDS